MRLLVIRHAIAQDRLEFHKEFPGTDDDLRPLTKDGIRKMHKNARGLKRVAGHPILFATSPLLRAKQTLAVLQEAFPDATSEICEALRPDADPEDLLLWLKNRTEARGPDAMIAVIGHEPHLSTFVSYSMSGLRKGEIVLKKGGACLLEFPRGITKSRGKLLWLLTPSILRR